MRSSLPFVLLNWSSKIKQKIPCWIIYVAYESSRASFQWGATSYPMLWLHHFDECFFYRHSCLFDITVYTVSTPWLVGDRKPQNKYPSRRLRSAAIRTWQRINTEEPSFHSFISFFFPKLAALSSTVTESAHKIPILKRVHKSLLTFKWQISFMFYMATAKRLKACAHSSRLRTLSRRFERTYEATYL